MSSRRRVPSYGAQERALEACQSCRAACVAVLTEAPIGSPPYIAAQAVVEAIDGLAEALTGDRRLFPTKPHSTP